MNINIIHTCARAHARTHTHTHTKYIGIIRIKLNTDK